jgi:hypothetical protein
MATHEAIVITNPEVRHIMPVLGEMLEEWKRNGPRSVICAACWAASKNIWYQHSSHYKTGFHHCNLLGRSLFGNAGGFDVEYRSGVAYDDTDFVQRLHAAGASFWWRDDLVVHHIDHETYKWDGPNNQGLFFKKWPSPNLPNGMILS